MEISSQCAKTDAAMRMVNEVVMVVEAPCRHFDRKDE